MSTAVNHNFHRRVVFLGASNLTLGLPLLVDLIRKNCDGPFDISSAHGLGRSYGIPNNVMGRTLPGILESQLWPALAKKTPLPTTALVTDIGNDLLYHVSVQQITDWVGEAISRLTQLGAEISITLLPVCNLEHLGRTRFYLFRTAFFPRCRLSYEVLVERAQQLNISITQLAQDRQLRAVEPFAHWYGLDAIHIVPHRWQSAWTAIMAPMFCHMQGEEFRAQRLAADGPLRAGIDVTRSALWMLKPTERRWIFGFEQHGPQPAVRLEDGTSVSFY